MWSPTTLDLPKIFVKGFYYTYQKLLEVRYNETFSRKGSWPPEAKVAVGFWASGICLSQFFTYFRQPLS